jgi:hypothetical protein
VPVFFRATFTLGIKPPDGSVTVPVISPDVSDCPESTRAMTAEQAIAIKMRYLILAVNM